MPGPHELTRILVPSAGPGSWRQFLAQPELHWATGYSARTLAHSWEAAGGIPKEVATVLEPHLGSIETLVIIPEHKTPLPGGRRESQSDVFLLARHASGTIACTIEGKVDEPFGPTVGQQMIEPSAGQQERFGYLCAMLGLAGCPDAIHYQLLHRTVSALIEAERFDASHAAMIVHSFSPTSKWFDAFAGFVAMLGGAARPDAACKVDVPGNRPLLLGWAKGDQRFRVATFEEKGEGAPQRGIGGQRTARKVGRVLVKVVARAGEVFLHGSHPSAGEARSR